MSRLLERVEELATARYGKGAAVSVDPSRLAGTRARVWDPKGNMVLESEPCRMKVDAVRALLRELVT